MIYNLERLSEYVDSLARPAAGKSPVIGISSHHAGGCSTLNDYYSNAVLKAGGIPLAVPVMTDGDALAALVDTMDALLLTGGGDISPLFYGEDPEKGLGEVDPQRDMYDFMLLKLCTDRMMPVMGICRGHQLINLYFGGKNYQDIASALPLSIQHSQQTDKRFNSHFVDIERSSLLYKLLGRERMAVNSVHHQAVSEVAPGFLSAAVSSDGINEAMEAVPVRPVYSVQWHPEAMSDIGDEMLPLFSYHVRQASFFKKAKEFHRNHCSVDSHCDTPMKFCPDMNLGIKDSRVKVDFRKMEEGMLDSVVMVAYLPQRERDAESLSRMPEVAADILEKIKGQLEKNAAIAGQAYVPSDVERLKKEGKKAVFLGIENGYAIGKDIRNLERFKGMGIVYMTLCHNGDNDICDSCRGESEHCGLSDFGEEVVREMNRLGIMVDISHASDQTVRDALQVSQVPIIASHSSARSICNHRRNLPDDLLREIAAGGGVIQATIYDGFVKEEGGAVLPDFINHINHIVEVAGIDHVGIGTDFDGDGGIPGCDSASEMLAVTMALYKEGYSDTELEKIWGGNFLRVMDEVQNFAG